MSLATILALCEAPEGWGCTSIRAGDDGGIELSFARDDDWVCVRVTPGAPRGRVFSRWPRCHVRYEGHLASPDADRKRDVAAILENVGARADRHLAAEGSFTALFARSAPRELEPTVEGVRAWLGLPSGAMLAAWSIDEVTPERDGVRIVLGGAAAVTAWLRERALVTQIDVDGDLRGATATLRTILRWRAQQRPLRLPPASVDPELKLQITSPCGQSCEFCSIPKHHVDRAERDDLVAAIAAGARRGQRKLRVTGLDPLSFPDIASVLRAATDAGYERIEIHSPSVRLADRAFCESVVAAMPEGKHFHVPLFGAAAEAHDAVVGVPGSFERVVAALGHLTRLVGPKPITLHTVCTRNVLPELGAIVRFARERSLSMSIDLPFPDTEAPSDRFYAVAPTQTEVVDVLLATELTLPELTRVAGLAPCVLHRRLDADRARKLRASMGDLRPAATGVRTPLVRCPHADTCGFIPACSGDVLRAYLQRFGDTELEPWRR